MPVPVYGPLRSAIIYFTDMILTGPNKPEGSNFELAW